MDWIFLVVFVLGFLWLIRYAWSKRSKERSSHSTINKREEKAFDEDPQFGNDTDKRKDEGFDIRPAELTSQATGGDVKEKSQELEESSIFHSFTLQAKKQLPPEILQRKRRRRLIDRGGRPRGQTTRSGGNKPKREITYIPKPDIVCWKRQTEWVLGVEVPEAMTSDPELRVLQNEITLQPVSYRTRSWQLKSITGKVRVDQKGVLNEVTLGEDPFLIFKLTGSNLSQGRYVKSISAGMYLVIVPQDWERHSDWEPAPVESEYVVIDGFRAHYFLLEHGLSKDIVFNTGSGNPIHIRTEQPRFELVGNRYDDGSEDIGPLFLQAPPRIQASNTQLWARISTVVVGEEGPGRGRWRASFKPIPESREQPLPSEIIKREASWFFLRFYNDNNDLVDSLDFRFVKGLEKLVLSAPSPLPGPKGHTTAVAEFCHNPDYIVLPLCETAKSLRITHRERKTTVEIPPEPHFDYTEWEIGPRDGPKVKVSILVERVWWALGLEDRKPEQWQDKLLELFTEDLAAASQKAIWLRLPKRRWIKALRVGFEYSKARRYRLKVNETELRIPLREFGDFAEVDMTSQEVPFKIWVEKDGRCWDCVVAVLPARSPASIQNVKTGDVAATRWVGLGRKKSAIAQVEMRVGDGRIFVNGEDYRKYFAHAPKEAMRFLERLMEVDSIREVLSTMDLEVTVQGSNPKTNRQVRAVAHAMARALICYDKNLKPVLRREGFGGVKVRKTHKKSIYGTHST